MQPAEGVPGVDVDDVVAGLQRAADRVAVPAPQVGDVGLGHRPRLDRVVVRSEATGRCCGAERGLPAVQVRAVEPVVRAARCRPARRPRGSCRRSARAPGRSWSSQSRSSMNGPMSEVGWISTCSVQTTAQPPSALTWRMAASARRVAVAHAVAVRHLEEAVPSGDRADRDRLEEDVVRRGRRARPGVDMTGPGGCRRSRVLVAAAGWAVRSTIAFLCG